MYTVYALYTLNTWPGTAKHPLNAPSPASHLLEMWRRWVILSLP